MYNFKTQCGLILAAINVGALACGSSTEFATLTSSKSTVGGQVSLTSGTLGGTAGIGGTAAGIGGTSTVVSAGGETSLSGGGTAPFSATGGTSADRDAGAPVWRNSTVPFCPTDKVSAFLPTSLSLWSDSRGVFLMARETSETIYFNDGNGWSVNYVDPKTIGNSIELTGFTSGPLVRYGTSPCGIEVIANGVFVCSAGVDQVTTVFTINQQIAYGSYANQPIAYDGARWTAWGNALSPSDDYILSLWASENTVAIGTSYGRVYKYLNADPTQAVLLPGLPAARNLALWGFASDNLWVGNNDGQIYRYDGSSWSPVWTATDQCGAIRGMWGASNSLYFITDSLIGTIRNGQVEILMNYGCGGPIQVQSLWGNSVSEVFFALTDTSQPDCGRIKLLWYNGVKLTAI